MKAKRSDKDPNNVKKDHKRSSIFSMQSQAEKRNLLSSFFVTLLIGLAYQEMIAPVQGAIQKSGVTWGTFVLFSVFFLTTIRFFIGAQLHLLSDNLLKMPGGVWFFDFSFIVLEMTVMVFLGGVTSIETSQEARFDFVFLLSVLYVLDVIWIFLQWLLGKTRKGWKRDLVPWAWALLNLSLILVLNGLRFVALDLYTTVGLWILLLANVVAFIVDVFLIDYYDVL